MEIRSLYKFLLSRLRDTDQGLQPPQGEKIAPPQTARGDRREFSSLLGALREAEKLDRQSEPAEAARLKELQEKVDRGLYDIDARKVAQAMLRSPGASSVPRGESK